MQGLRELSSRMSLNFTRAEHGNFVVPSFNGNAKLVAFEGKTGFAFKPRDSSDLARSIENYFESDLFRDLEHNRPDIKRYANERYSWNKVAEITTAVYSNLLADR